MDSLGDDLVLMCQLQGKKHRLEAIKAQLQTSNLYHIALLMCIRDELQAEMDLSRDEEGAGKGQLEGGIRQHVHGQCGEYHAIVVYSNLTCDVARCSRQYGCCRREK